MIYIFSSFQNICSLPGYCCQFCGQACKSCPGACKAITGPLEKCCKNCGSTTKEFFAMPLSVYVLLSFAVSGWVASSAMTDLSVPKNATGTSGGTTEAQCASNFLLLYMGFAVLNAIFAVYVQCRVWKEIVSDVPDEEGISNKDRIREFTDQQNQEPQKEGMLAKGKKGGGALLGQGLAAGAAAMAQARGQAAPAQSNQAAEPDPEIPAQPGKRIVPATVVQASFKKVFMEDLGVLLMFFLMIGMCVVASQGETLLDDPKTLCKVRDQTRSEGYLFFILAFLFSSTYLCCTCCSNKVAIPEEDPAEESGAE